MNRKSAFMLVALAFSLVVGPPGATDGAMPDIAVEPFEIREFVPPEDNVRPPPATGLAERLSQAATDRAARTAVRSGLALRTNVTRPDGAGSASTRLTGTVWVPLRLGSEIRGRRAFFRPGTFVRADVRWRHADGTVSESSARLRWRDVWWTSGTRMHRARPIDDVLRDGVRKVVDAAVKRLRVENPSEGPING